MKKKNKKKKNPSSTLFVYYLCEVCGGESEFYRRSKKPKCPVCQEYTPMVFVRAERLTEEEADKLVKDKARELFDYVKWTYENSLDKLKEVYEGEDDIETRLLLLLAEAKEINDIAQNMVPGKTSKKEKLWLKKVQAKMRRGE